MKTLVQIVPRLPPSIDGVGDYALNLAQQLRKDFGITTHFIVCDPSWAKSSQIEGFSVSQISAHSADSLLLLLPKGTKPTAAVLLHYVGYGYAKRGCPVWLVDGLQRWRNTNANQTLLTMFHELYAFGLPWTSSFWLSSLQRCLAVRLAQISDRCLTSLKEYAKTLCELSHDKQANVSVIPVFSNIGEPARLSPLAQRCRRLVVFGGQRHRRKVYQKFLTELGNAAQFLGIKEIWDIGPPTGLTLPRTNSVPITEMGKCSPTEISDILLNSLAGFLSYNPNRLAKSGIFAAYCAHGVLPVSSQYSQLIIDGIEPKKHYWISGHHPAEFKDQTELQTIADNAHQWYQSHNLSIHAKTFACYLIDNADSGGIQ